RLVLVLQEVEDGHEQQAHRLGQVQGAGHLGGTQQRVAVAQVRLQVGGGALRRAVEQGACVGHDDRVVVDVDHAHGRVDRLGDLVGVVRGGDAGADVEELPHTGLGGQVGHRPAQEAAVLD